MKTLKEALVKKNQKLKRPNRGVQSGDFLYTERGELYMVLMDKDIQPVLGHGSCLNCGWDAFDFKGHILGTMCAGEPVYDKNLHTTRPRYIKIYRIYKNVVDVSGSHSNFNELYDEGESLILSGKIKPIEI